MIFDDKISETVSLSKVLDCFIEENEKPSVILSFLEQYENELDDIFSCSRLYFRMLSLDFISKCSSIEVMKIYKLMKNGNINNEVSMYLCWQVLHSNISNDIKDIFRSFYNLFKKSIQHPYKGCIGKEASLYDTIWCDVNRNLDEIINMFNTVSIKRFERIIKTLDNSLWKYRFLQCDIFENLTVDRQWIVVNGLQNLRNNSLNIDFFFRQILSSTQLSNEVKSRIFLIMKTPVSRHMSYSYFSNYDEKETNNLPKEIEKEIDEMEDASQFVIKLRLFGMELYLEHAIVYLIKNNRIDILFELLDYMEDDIRDNFDIVDLLKYMKNDLKEIH